MKGCRSRNPYDRSNMCDGCRCQVVLLDERRLDIVVQPKLYSGELLDIVASHFQLREKEYFGISWQNEMGQWSWLQLDKRVLEHEFPKKATSQGASVILYFRVKYFVESVSQLKDAATVEAFYLQAKSLLAKGDLEGDSETVFQLAALALQVAHGNYVDEATFISHVRRMPVLPSFVLKEQPSLAVCEEKVVQYYKNFVGLSRGAAIIKYLSLVETLPTYGQHYYEIKDKTGTSCYVGLSYKGISQYDKHDRRNPKRVFLWKQLENLYYRDKKFTIEVHERRVVHTLSSFNLYEDAIDEPVEDYDELSNAICDPTTQVSVSRRTLAPANVTVYVWYAVSPVITKCIWSMAIAQHHFFLDRKHRKAQSGMHLNLSQIASELCRSVQSLSSLGSQPNISRSSSSISLPSTILGGEISLESKAAAIDMLVALRTRKEALEETLRKKTEELKALCIKEGELTGEIPPETPLLPGESQPHVRRRVGTSFSISDTLLCKIRSKEQGESLSDLELEYELQRKIATAALQLANDCTARKSVRKQRQLSYSQATAKLRCVEQKLSTLKKEKSKSSLKDQDATDGNDPCGSNLSINSDISGSCILETVSLREGVHDSFTASATLPRTFAPQSIATTQSASATSTNVQEHQHNLQVPFSPISNADGQNIQTPYNECSWNRSYSDSLKQDSTKCSPLTLSPPYRNRFESSLNTDGLNLYSVPNRRASQVFDSQDDLLLCGKKCNAEKKSSDAQVTTYEPEYANTLSTSCDDRLWHERKINSIAAASSDGSSLDNSFETQSMCSYDTTSLNRYESIRRRRTQDSVKSSPVSQTSLHHFRSEGMLLKDGYISPNSHQETIHISEPDLSKDKQIQTDVPHHTVNVPYVREDPHHVHKQHYVGNNNETGSSCISQVADLVQASMLLQEGKKMTLNSLNYMCPKTKIKEWTETSLDSPVPLRKSRTRHASGSTRYISNMNEEVPHFAHSTVQVKVPLKASYKDSSSVETHEISKFSYSCLQDSSSDNSNFQHCDQVVIPSIRLSVTPLYSPNKSIPLAEDHIQPIHITSPGSVQRSDFHSIATNIHSSHHNYDNSINHNMNEVYYSQGHYIPREEVEESCLGMHSEAYNNSGIKDQPWCPTQPDIPDYENTTEFYREHNIQYSNTQNVPYRCDSKSSIHQVIPYSPPQPSHMQQACLFNNSYTSETHSGNTSLHNSSDCNKSQDSLVINMAQEVTLPQTTCSSAFPFPRNVEVNVVSMGHFQPYWEETKPYELSDFYKYSTKHRKSFQKGVDCAVDTLNDIETELTEMNYQEIPQRDLHRETEALSATSDRYAATSHGDVTKGHADCNNPDSRISLQDADVQLRKVPNIHPCDGKENDRSFEDRNVHLSLADTFHEEMLSWYHTRETTKKATLV